ncbi:MAG: hypothetical protein V4793_10940 [Paraburkholderia tropica]|uniref:hypothetical protein n=1 Tax=Paraburkholderia tropica TaxID=92647 RepID=UPI0011B58407|nr:hypothetical protein [Paraburkholderia tropica]MBB3003906.1 hypothetical protein [Paraburkholderia tropica]MBB6322750.1 hypothetical protein [Paraburkholderia tropica]MDE1144154.1 hypothetical protein [Paraburkholderia tropica]
MHGGQDFEPRTEGKDAIHCAAEAAAFDYEANPKELAARRGNEVKKFLMLLGLASDDIIVDERIIKIKNGKIDPDDKLQIGVEFVPKCPPAGCQSLCNVPNLQGVASYAVTSETPGPAPESNTFSCGDKREPKYGRIIRKEIWTESTREKVITLSTDGVKPRSGVCYRITTSAHRYVGMTDDQGRTQPIQLLGPEYTTIEVKVDQYAN